MSGAQKRNHNEKYLKPVKYYPGRIEVDFPELSRYEQNRLDFFE